MAELKMLKAQRGYEKGKITRTLAFIRTRDLSQLSLEILALKKREVQATYEAYESLNREIFVADTEDKEDIESVENTFYTILQALGTALDKAGPQPSLVLETAPRQYNRISLPPIQIQNFNGKFTEYIPFISMFRSMIDNDQCLDGLQKLYYLRNFLRDEPFDLIKNLPMCSESYQESLKLLDDRYNNRQKIVNQHIGKLLDIKIITRSTASSLREFVSSVRQEIAAIKTHEPTVKHWDPILLCIFFRRLDPYTVRSFQLERCETEAPSLEELLRFLEKRATAMETADQQSHPVAHHSKLTAHIASVPSASGSVECIYCKLEHKLFQCKKFILLAPVDRVKFAKDKKLCEVCLCSHTGKCRYFFRSTECKQAHNTLLHYNPLSGPVVLTGNVNNVNVLLPTVKLKIFGNDGTVYHIRALLDSGSQVSFVTTKVVDRLGLNPEHNVTDIIGISNAKSKVKYCIPIEIQSIKSQFKTTATFHVVDQITCNLPQYKFDISSFNIPPEIVLADDQFNIPGEVNMLIGSDLFFQTILPSSHPTQYSQPHNEATSSSQQAKLRIINTEFGHVIGGNIPLPKYQPVCGKVVLKCELDRSQTINNRIMSQFWSHDKVPEIFNEKTSEQELCEQMFKDSVQLENNQFKVALPLKLPMSEVSEVLGDSFHLALRRFLNLEKKLHANLELFKQYKEFIHEFLTLNHGHFVDIELYELNKQATYFLPHHAVINVNSKTTKLRTVFDGSMKTSKKISLNDLQLNGPIVQRDIFDIIMLFRLGKYTFSADIRRMFRNIRVDPMFTSLQNILWRDDQSEPIKCIQLDTVTYGLKSSSYLATRCLVELAYRFEDSYPLASFVVKNNTYNKWASNDERVLSDIPPSEQHFDCLDLQKENFSMKTLGLQINIKDDQFIISSPDPYDEKIVTKRSMLSYIGRCYDPMGFVSPILVTAKAIMQKLWISDTDWNETPPQDVQKEWLSFTADLANMKPILLSRNLNVTGANIAERNYASVNCSEHVNEANELQPMHALLAKDSEWVDVLHTTRRAAVERASSSTNPSDDRMIPLDEARGETTPFAAMFPGLVHRDPQVLEGIATRTMSTTEITRRLVILDERADFTAARKMERLIPKNMQWLEPVIENSLMETATISTNSNESIDWHDTYVMQ